MKRLFVCDFVSPFVGFIQHTQLNDVIFYGTLLAPNATVSGRNSSYNGNLWCNKLAGDINGTLLSDANFCYPLLSPELDFPPLSSATTSAPTSRVTTAPATTAASTTSASTTSGATIPATPTAGSQNGHSRWRWMY
jgi:hypothetical protein